MKSIKATVSLIVFCALFVPLLLAPESLAAKTHASKSRAKPVAAKTAKTAKPATKVAKPAAVVPLPDRNPNRVAVTAPFSPDAASTDTTEAIAKQPLPRLPPRRKPPAFRCPSAIPSARPRPHRIPRSWLRLPL
jgi:hypothetical protein